MTDLLHSDHMCNFSPLRVNIWLASWLEYLNDLHTCCKDVGLPCPRSDLFSSSCLLYMICPSTFTFLAQVILVLFFLISTFNFGPKSSQSKLHLHGQNSRLRKDLISSKNYVILQIIVIEYTIRVPSIHPGPISNKNNSSKT